jgi:hypothetical protein
MEVKIEKSGIPTEATLANIYHNSKPAIQTTPAFEGRSNDIEGFVFDCTDGW